MISMSLDMSTTCIGWSIWDDDILIDYGKLKPLEDDLEWRERIQDFVPQLHNIMKKYMPKKVYAEDIPLIKKQMITLVQLGAVQGMLLGICYSHNVEVEFKNVGTWRKDIGISCGEKDRNHMKIKSIQKANELFNLDLKCIITKSGNYNSKKSDDDIADSILLYASTRDKYKVSKKAFGRR